MEGMARQAARNRELDREARQQSAGERERMTSWQLAEIVYNAKHRLVAEDAAKFRK